MKRTSCPHHSLQTWLLLGTAFLLLLSEVLAASRWNGPLEHIQQTLRGKSKPVKIYKLLGRKGALKNERLRSLEA